MKSYRVNSFVSILIILLILGFIYLYNQTEINHSLSSFLNKIQPCKRPITYSIGEIDTRFGLTETELLNEIMQAEKIWESSIDKQLFEYSPTGKLKINFIYDYRQRATNAMEDVGIVIDDNKSNYDVLKAKRDSLIISYNKEKAKIESLIKDYTANKSIYEKSVSNWNNQKRGSEEQYNILEKERIALNNKAKAITEAERSINQLAEAINSTGIILNKLIVTLNLNVEKYNTIGASTGEKFDEGEYISDSSGATINIFQYDSANRLLRVLAHEFGHALGLGHIDNTKAIMYYLNEGMNDELTIDDLNALKRVCKME